MKIAIIAITGEGAKLAALLTSELNCHLFLKKGIQNETNVNHIYTFESLSECVNDIFYKYEGLIFVMSLGIVNRMIAPLMKSKYSDPAVVTVDEMARYAISTLSGHEGGANELTFRVSSLTGATPVITTASEANRVYICGVGARKGISKESVLSAIGKACQMTGIIPKDLRCLASAWVKKDETGLIEAAGELNLNIRFIPKHLIRAYYEDKPAAERSQFVNNTIGVFGVAEPCAILAGENSEIILRKQHFDGVTVCVAKERLAGEGAEAESTEGMVLILGGTTEAFRTAEELAEKGEHFYISTATEYGYNHFLERFPERIIKERFNPDSLQEFIDSHKITKVMDCSHPYAEIITETAKEVCLKSGTEYISKVRTERDYKIEYDKVKYVSSLDESAEVVRKSGLKKVLYTTGSKNLDFVSSLEESELFVRVLPYEESIRACVEAGIKRSNIIAMHGPFTRELNEAIIRQYSIDCVVTKKSGKEGGLYEKIEAARSCGIWIIVYQL